MADSDRDPPPLFNDDLSGKDDGDDLFSSAVQVSVSLYIIIMSMFYTSLLPKNLIILYHHLILLFS